MIFQLLAQALDMYVNRAAVADILITPDMIQQLLSGEDLIRRGGQEIEELAPSAAYPDVAHTGDGIVGQVHGKIGKMDDLAILPRFLRLLYKGAAENRIDAGTSSLESKGLMI